jgi:hypothetical protein
MTPATARQLLQRLPRLFADGDGFYPFRCTDGYYPLLYDLATKLVALEPPEADLHVNLVSEKEACGSTRGQCCLLPVNNASRGRQSRVSPSVKRAALREPCNAGAGGDRRAVPRMPHLTTCSRRPCSGSSG